ncbi:MAG: 1-acyl-sn-glycerol-3-phosphate acyltransferase [Blautia sp.]|nr:1-acyl-sn-glycerol-3-phosphate acyltransferase [Blautia sp.]
MNIHIIFHPVLLTLMKKQRQYKLHIMNKLPALERNILIAANHSCKHDFPIVSEVIGRQAYVLVGKQRLEVIDRLCFFFNGAIYVNRRQKRSKKEAGRKVLKCLKRGRNVCIFPEGTWNLESSRPMLPLYWGIIDLARESGCPILPIVLEYRGKDCYIKFGQLMYINAEDDKEEKIEELRDVMATLKWEIWEMFLSVPRDTVVSDEWEREVIRRVAEYPKFDYEYEMSFVRSV